MDTNTPKPTRRDRQLALQARLLKNRNQLPALGLDSAAANDEPYHNIL